MSAPIDIRIDDLSGADTRALITAHLSLITAHLSGMSALSPAESVHALGIEKLRDPSITVWSAWRDDRLAGVGALKALDGTRGELKSMRVDDAFLGTGVGRAILRHIVADAQARGMTSLWLETGTSADSSPAHRLYASEGFALCGPFADYALDPESVFMTRWL